ncbi:hypothetical protein [Marivirga sp.]|nr:hypothetical protein [Marivirga sp.]HET8860016.1 hypothetical protein [Marivirga sp.]
MSWGTNCQCSSIITQTYSVSEGGTIICAIDSGALLYPGATL